MLLLTGADLGGGVQGVRTPALLLGVPFLKIMHFQNVVYFHYAWPQKSSILTDNFVPFNYVQCRDFFISENERKNFETINYI